MTTSIPSIAEVERRLLMLKPGEIDRVAVSSGVPISTLWKIRTGVTLNPGIETVRKFYSLLPEPTVGGESAGV